MPSILNATDMDPNANSYCTLQYADAYLKQNRLYVDVWRAAAGQTTVEGYLIQETALIWATAILDKTMWYKGWKQTITQALRWPRSGCFDRDGYYILNNVVPDKMRQITAQYAMELIAKNRLAEPATLGIGITGNVKLGPIQVTLDSSNAIPFVPMYLREELYLFGFIDSLGEGKSGMVRLSRV